MYHICINIDHIIFPSHTKISPALSQAIEYWQVKLIWWTVPHTDSQTFVELADYYIIWYYMTNTLEIRLHQVTVKACTLLHLFQRVTMITGGCRSGDGEGHAEGRGFWSPRFCILPWQDIGCADTVFKLYFVIFYDVESLHKWVHVTCPVKHIEWDWKSCCIKTYSNRLLISDQTYDWSYILIQWRPRPWVWEINMNCITLSLTLPIHIYQSSD